MPQRGVAVPSEQSVAADQWPPQPEPRTEQTRQPRPRQTPIVGSPVASHGGAGVPGRRTITIRGVGAEAWAVQSSSRSRASSGARSASGGPHSASGTPRPASGTPRPASGAPRPASGTPRPASGTPRPASGARRRPRAYERSGFRPDRVAMWAVLLGVVLILVAAASSHAAQTLTAAHHPASPAAPLSFPAQVRAPQR
jgi:hypothetical protein